MPFGRSGQAAAAALLATIAACRAAPLGSWSVTYGAGCPAEFPFRSMSHDSALQKNICYESIWQAAAGTGPCGSWCTMDVTVGAGCGDNSGRLCGAGPSYKPDEATAHGESAAACPAEFPFRSMSHDSALRKNICYESKWQAAAGTGPCGSWCTMDVTVGTGCGDNSGRLCGAGPSYKPDETTAHGGNLQEINRKPSELLAVKDDVRLPVKNKARPHHHKKNPQPKRTFLKKSAPKKVVSSNFSKKVVPSNFSKKLAPKKVVKQGH